MTNNQDIPDDLPETDWDALYDLTSAAPAREPRLDARQIHDLFPFGDGSIAAVLTTVDEPADKVTSGDHFCTACGQSVLERVLYLAEADGEPDTLTAAGAAAAIVENDERGHVRDFMLYADVQEARRDWRRVTPA